MQQDSTLISPLGLRCVDSLCKTTPHPLSLGKCFPTNGRDLALSSLVPDRPEKRKAVKIEARLPHPSRIISAYLYEVTAGEYEKNHFAGFPRVKTFDVLFFCVCVLAIVLLIQVCGVLCDRQTRFKSHHRDKYHPHISDEIWIDGAFSVPLNSRRVVDVTTLVKFRKYHTNCAAFE